VSEPDESLRVSDAERDAVPRTLGDNAAVGRLTLDELEEGLRIVFGQSYRHGRSLQTGCVAIGRDGTMGHGLGARDGPG
jgi:hypothetical protein